MKKNINFDKNSKMKIQIFLLITTLTFLKLNLKSQETIIWDTNLTESFKDREEFNRGFNIEDYDKELLKSCLQEILNYARQTNKNKIGDALEFNYMLEAAAQLQADFMAKNKMKTIDNKKRFNTTQKRVEYYGGTHNVKEIVEKIKIPDESFSYLNLVTNLFLNILNNPKHSGTILDTKWTLVGFGMEPDDNYRMLYCSIVLGTSKTINTTKYQTETLTLPVTTKKFGLTPNDPKKCKKCEQFRNIESLHNCLKVVDDVIYFEYDNLKALRQLISRSEDGLAVDIITKEQYLCGLDNILDFDRVNKGYLTKPIYYDKLMKNNEETDKKSNKISIPLGNLPKDLSGDYELNLIIIKDGSVCRSIHRTYIENNKEAHIKTTYIMPDTISIQATPFTISSEKKSLEFILPIKKGKKVYTTNDITPYLKVLNTGGNINLEKLKITIFSSIIDNNKKSFFKIQRKRAISIGQSINKFANSNIKFEIIINNGWELFVRDVKKTPHSKLSNLTASEARKKLKGSILKDLKPYLKNHYYVKINLDANLNVLSSNEKTHVIDLYNDYINKNDTKNAYSIQKFIINKVIKKSYNAKDLKNMRWPKIEKKNLPLLINMHYLLNYNHKIITQLMYEKMTNYTKLDPQNQIASYNKAIYEVYHKNLDNESTIKDIQTNLDLLYSFTKIPKQFIDEMNIDFQFNVIKATKESDDLQLIALNEEALKNTKLITERSEKIFWKDAFRLVGLLINNNEYSSAIYIMKRYIDDDNISKNFAFTYLTLLATKDDFYLTPSFSNTVNLCLKLDKQKLCNTLKKFSFQVLENKEAKKTFCEECN